MSIMLIQKMKIAYLLESTILCGGVKVVCRQAEELGRRGHQVVVFSPGEYPDWFDSQIQFERRDQLDPEYLKTFDRIIGTSPEMLLSLHRYPGIRRKLWHLVQGYEGDCEEAQSHIPMIEEAYSLPIPKMTVSKCLTDRLERIFPAGAFYSIGQGLESQYFYPAEDNVNEREEVVDTLFIIGPLTISVKQIVLGLDAYALAKKAHPYLRLVRIALVDTRQEEEDRVGKIGEYHVLLRPREVGDVFRSRGGVLLSSSTAGEGFGLPALEAMACGVPTVLTKIPSYLAFGDPQDYAAFVPYDDPRAMADAIYRLLKDDEERRRLIKRGSEVAALYSYERVGEAIEEILYDV